VNYIYRLKDDDSMKGDLGAFYPSFVVGARLASPHGTLKDGSQSSYAISTKNGIRHEKNAGTRKGSGTRKVLHLG
jgi:hypothetical protein